MVNRRLGKGAGATYPTLSYSMLTSVAYGKSVKETGLDGQIIKAKQLEEIAVK